jgi:hypothetical protein
MQRAIALEGGGGNGGGEEEEEMNNSLIGIANENF